MTDEPDVRVAGAIWPVRACALCPACRTAHEIDLVPDSGGAAPGWTPAAEDRWIACDCGAVVDAGWAALHGAETGEGAP